MHGDETPVAYLNRAQEYADALVAIGEPVKDKDLVMLTISVGSLSMTEPRQAQLLELAAQLSAFGFQVSPITPSGPQAFYGARSNNNNNNINMSNNNNNRGNRNNSCDTGTNSHVTPDLAAMDTSEAYYGDDALHVGN
nr:nucleotide-binding, alpha-beta plait [Tanacetum cinerariifolium]